MSHATTDSEMEKNKSCNWDLGCHKSWWRTWPLSTHGYKDTCELSRDMFMDEQDIENWCNKLAIKTYHKWSNDEPLNYLESCMYQTWHSQLVYKWIGMEIWCWNMAMRSVSPFIPHYEKKAIPWVILFRFIDYCMVIIGLRLWMMFVKSVYSVNFHYTL